MKKLYFIFVALLCQGVVHANCIDDLKNFYFEKIKFYDSGYTIQFKKQGVRFFIKKNNEPSRLSQYGEVLKVSKKDFLAIIERSSSIHIIPYDKMNEKDKVLIDNEASTNVYLIMCKGFNKSKAFVFVTDNLAIAKKTIIIKSLKENPDFSVKEQDNFIIAQDISKAFTKPSGKPKIIY